MGCVTNRQQPDRMPEPKAFADAFHLYELPGAVVSIRHIVVRKFAEYHFPIRVTFHGDARPDTAQQPVVCSRYGNPYRCWLDDVHVHHVRGTDQHVFTAMGKAVRIHDRVDCTTASAVSK